MPAISGQREGTPTLRDLRTHFGAALWATSTDWSGKKIDMLPIAADYEKSVPRHMLLCAGANCGNRTFGTANAAFGRYFFFAVVDNVLRRFAISVNGRDVETRVDLGLPPLIVGETTITLRAPSPNKRIGASAKIAKRYKNTNGKPIMDADRAKSLYRTAVAKVEVCEANVHAATGKAIPVAKAALVNARIALKERKNNWDVTEAIVKGRRRVPRKSTLIYKGGTYPRSLLRPSR